MCNFLIDEIHRVFHSIFSKYIFNSVFCGKSKARKSLTHHERGIFSERRHRSESIQLHRYFVIATNDPFPVTVKHKGTRIGTETERKFIGFSINKIKISCNHSLPKLAAVPIGWLSYVMFIIISSFITSEDIHSVKFVNFIIFLSGNCSSGL